MWLKRERKQEDSFLEKAINGDRIGLEYLVRSYKDMAYTIAIKILRNNEDAEEVVQDSFMKAFASLPKFRRASKFSTWLFRIVYTTSISKLKTRKQASLNWDDVSGGDHPFVENLEYDVLRGEERKKYIAMALDRLSEGDRLVVTLHYIGEKSISEICDIMGKERSAIKMRLLRGRKEIEFTLGSLLKGETRELL